MRHNLSLHSRFVKVQNESSGKSSWWTVNLDAKSGRTGRRSRSQSVDNSNNSSPKTKKKKERSKVKKLSKDSCSPKSCSSPCDSPTTVQPLLQPPWSPNPSCPSPTNSEFSCYSPVLRSPGLQRSRNITPVSPLISPPAIDQQNGTLFSSQNSIHDAHEGHEYPLPLEFSSLSLRSSQETMGSSSSLSSLNSPRPPTAPSIGNKSPHLVFSFPPFVDSSGYSSSTYYSDTDREDSKVGILSRVVIPEAPLPPPSYEDHLYSGGHRQVFTPTRSHQLHQCLIFQANARTRPRSTSEPMPPPRGFPQDLADINLQYNDLDCDMDTIIQNELYENGHLDFQFDQQPSSSPLCDPMLTSAAIMQRPS